VKLKGSEISEKVSMPTFTKADRDMLNNNNKTVRTEEDERFFRENIYSYYY